MKLRNKKTGEIKEVQPITIGGFRSLAELNENWEDYEEPKGHWTIDPMNEDYIDDGKYTAPDELERYEELGLKFETKEEAEKAVEKLKAWKRLKDKGFRFVGLKDDFIKWDIPNKQVSFDEAEKYWDDFYLLFGGEE